MLLLLVILAIFNRDIYCEYQNDDLEFLITFLRYKTVTLTNFYTCYDPKSTVNSLKMFYKNNLRALSVNFPRKHDLGYFNHRYAFIIDVDCFYWPDVLRQKLKDIKYRTQQYGLLLCKNQTAFIGAKQKLRNMNLRLDSNIFVALKSEKYCLFEFYNPGHGYGGETIFYNSVNYTNGNLDISNFTTYDFRKDLSALHLKVAFVITKNVSNPAEYLEDVRTKQDDTSSKVNFGVFRHMLDIHKYTWKLIPTPSWFGAKRRGVEAGLANALTQNIADISGSSGLMTPGRIEAFDFGVGTYLFRTSFLYISPTAYQGDVKNAFVIKPFSRDTWICFAIATTILIVTTKLVLQCEMRLLKRNRGKYSWCAIIISMVASVCQQGNNIQHSSIASRILMLSTFIFTFVSYNYYTSSIVSSVINSEKASFGSVKELIESRFDIGIEQIAFARVLNATADPLLAHLDKQAKSNSSRIKFYPQPTGIDSIRRENFAYAAETVTAYNSIEKTFSNKEICETSELNAARPTLLYIVGKKNGQFNEMFSISYRRIAQYGLLKRQQNLFSNEKPHCMNSIQFVRVGIEQAAFTIILLAVGYVLALAILTAELIIFKIHPQNNKQ